MKQDRRAVKSVINYSRRPPKRAEDEGEEGKGAERKV